MRKLFELVIVDDEPAIRKGLIERIDWESLGFKVAFSADDGEDVLSYLEQYHLDVLLTDIRMSVVSGLQVAERVYRDHIPVEVVLLSGYKDFEYARQAMKFGVRHYLLKPSTAEEVRRVFDSIRITLESRHPDEVRAADERRRALMLLARERRRLLADLINGLVPVTSELLARWQRCMLVVPTPGSAGYYFITRVKHNRTDFTRDDGGRLGALVLGTHYSEQDRFSSIAHFEEPDLLHVLVVFRERTIPSSERAMYLDLVLRRHLGFSFAPEQTLFVGQFISLDEAAELFLKRADPHRATHAGDMERLVLDMIKSAEAGDVDRTRELTSECLSLSAGDGAVSPAEMRDAAINLCALLRLHIQRLYGITPPDSLRYDGLMRASQVDEVIRWAQEYTSRMASHVVAAERRTDRDVISVARSHIRSHLAEDLTLEQIARICYLSPIYFSRLFRQESGSTFIEYLTECRMEAAADLLKDHPELQIGEIARRVGYRDADYFSRIFRKRYGRTPSTYRRFLGARDES